jgi:hypothetical protein
MYPRCCMCPRRPLRPLLILLALVYGVFVLLQLTGCASSLMAREPRTLHVALAPLTPQEAYTKAAKAAAQFGMQIQTNDPHSRMLSGTKNTVLQMNILVDEASVVSVTCQLLPGYIILPSGDECVEYRQLLTGARADAR